MWWWELINSCYVIYNFSKEKVCFILAVLCQCSLPLSSIPANKYLVKAGNTSTGKRCELCSKLTIKTLKRHHDVVLVSVVDLFLVFILLTLNRLMLAVYSFHLCLTIMDALISTRNWSSDFFAVFINPAKYKILYKLIC